MKRLFFLVLTAMLYNINYSYALSDTIKLYFDLNVHELSNKNSRKLDSLVYSDAINNKTSVLIIGYTDFLGSDEDNKKLSERRATSIQQQLLYLNIPEPNIKLCIGKGEINRDIKKSGGYTTDRRVDIVISDMRSIQKKSSQKTSKESKINKPLLPESKAKITLNDIKVGQSIRLENIYFIMGRHYVTEASYPQLDNLYEILENNTNLKIQIEGHICCLTIGYDAEDEDTHLRNLSVARAKYIYDYLVKKGIEKDRMRVRGFGRSMPISWPEKSTEDEDKNRRVEIRVIEK